MNSLKNSGESNRKLKIVFAVFWILLVAFIIRTRIKYHSPYLFSWDSVQFALSLKHFDVRLHQPHPPGYLLYSFTVRLWNALIGDPNIAMISLNVIATIATCVVIASLIMELCRELPVDRQYLLAAGGAAIFATTPIVWLYSCLAEIYPVEGFFTALVSYLVIVSWRKPRYLLWASAAIAIAGGFRPTTEFFLIPFYAAGYLGKDKKTVISCLALFLISNAIWMVTLVSLTGGFSSYLSVLGKQTEVSFADTDITEQTARALLGVHTIPFRLIQACSIPVLFALLVQFWKIRPSRRDLALLLITVPSLLFFLFVHYSKEGYLFVVYVPLLIFLVAQFGKLYKNLALICIVFLLACFLNYQAFVKPPLYNDQEASQSKYKWVLNQLTFPNKHVINARTARLQDFLKTVDQLNPGPKLFVFLGEYTPDWRTLMYYRPDDQTLLVAPRRKRASVAHNRVYQVVTSPYTLNPAIRTVVALSKEDPGMKMDSFELYEYRYFYSLKRDLPGRFQIYGFEFER